MSIWKDFEKMKNSLFEDRKIAGKLGLLAIASKPSVIKHPPKSPTVKLLKLLKAVRKIEKDFPVDGFNSNIVSIIRDLKVEIEYNLSLYEAPEESNSKRRGPKSYPPELKNWIFNLIDLAKKDSKKLRILVEFFSPNKEFDKWLSEKSHGVWGGPLKKRHLDMVESDEVDFKWLNDFKNSQVSKK